MDADDVLVSVVSVGEAAIKPTASRITIDRGWGQYAHRALGRDMCYGEKRRHACHRHPTL
jgi:hypothetical protein